MKYMHLQQKVNNKAVKEMDHRLCAIPRYPGLIVLKNGLENISKFTANDYRNIMKVIVFVIDNLYENYEDGFGRITGVYNWILSRICHVIFRLFFESLQNSKTSHPSLSCNSVDSTLRFNEWYVYGNL